MRIINGVLAGSSVLLGGYLAIHHLSLEIYLSAISVLLITTGGNLINDYFDIKTDQINNPKRLIPSGKMKRIHVLYLASGFFIIGNVILALLEINLLYIGIIATLLLILYTPFLKPKPLLGNITVSILLSLTIILGVIASRGAIEKSFFPATLVFFLNLPREILKDGADIVGDRKANLRTFPIVFGAKKAYTLVKFLLVLLLLLIIGGIFYYGNLFGITAFSGVGIPIIIILYRAKISPKWFRNAERILKITVIPGMIALLLSAIK